MFFVWLVWLLFNSKVWGHRGCSQWEQSWAGLSGWPLTGQYVGVAVLGSVDGQISGFMRQIETDALQLLTDRQITHGSHTHTVLTQKHACRSCVLRSRYLKLQRELVRWIFAHVFDVGVKITELNWTEDTNIIIHFSQNQALEVKSG